MVSKIAVMALVAVVAVPILLGYGLNINTESRQVWAENDDPMDAKDYLMTTFDATGATYTDADTYQMNTNIFYRNLWTVDAINGIYQKISFFPDYPFGSITSTKTALAMDKGVMHTNFDLYSSWGFCQCFVNGTYDANNYYTLKSYNNGAHLLDYSNIKYATLDNNILYVFWYDSNGAGHYQKVNNVTNISCISTGYPTASLLYGNSNGRYVDLTKGYRLNTDGAVWDPSNFNSSAVESVYLEISKTTKSVLLSVDLSTLTNSDAVFRISAVGDLFFKKTTTNGTVKWEYSSYAPGGTPQNFQELYYNPLAASNTYQIYINADLTGELRYIGGWSGILGPAVSMITYPFEVYHNPNLPVPDHITGMSIRGYTPIMRIDAARVGAYDYRVMEDAVYDPAAFRANPITTLTNGLRFGSSLEFGGNTYQVTKGNITIGTHDFSLEGMEFESVQVGGQYENRINGNTVSTTATPSTITFNGKWLTDVTTESQSMETVSDTKWEPGKFAWNGIDTDFKIAGLMASLGAFIALAVYGRRSGTKVMPLLVVCGGAALMFLVMI